MNKKVFVLVLVVLLAMTCAFAYKGEMKVGANIGYGADGWGQSTTSSGNTNTRVALDAGLYAAGTFQYGIANDFYFKAEVGVNTFSKHGYSDNGEKSKVIDSDRTANVIASVAILYDIPIGKIFAIDLQIGADTIFGMPSYWNSKYKKNVGCGLSFGSGVAINFTDDFALNFNSKVTVYFSCLDSDYAKMVSDLGLILIGLQENIGITYSL